MYLTQAGSTNYTMTGGTISLSGAVNGAGGDIVLGDGANTGGSLTINGPTALLFTPNISLNGSVGGPGSVYLANGTVQTDSIFGTGPFSNFYFSGGTLQPQDGSVYSVPGNGWGEPGDNFTMTLSGTSAVMDSTDATGNGQIVNVYAGLAGTGGVHLTGSGTLILGAGNLANNTYSGGSFIDSGTVQLGSTAALGVGIVAVNGGTLDLTGISPTIGSLSGSAAGLIANISGATNSMLTVNESGTSTYAGTIANGPTNTTGLTLTGSGTLYLTGTNTYTGGTIVTGDAQLIVTNSQALADNSSLIVGNASAFGGVTAAGAASAANASSSPSPVPEPGTAALLCSAAAAILALARGRRRSIRRRRLPLDEPHKA